MFRLDVLQNQWLILAYIGGLVVMLGFICFYVILWRPRVEQTEPLSGGRLLLKWIPLIIYALIIGIIIYQIGHTILLHYYVHSV